MGFGYGMCVRIRYGCRKSQLFCDNEKSAWLRNAPLKILKDFRWKIMANSKNTWAPQKGYRLDPHEEAKKENSRKGALTCTGLGVS